MKWSSAFFVWLQNDNCKDDSYEAYGGSYPEPMSVPAAMTDDLKQERGEEADRSKNRCIEQKVISSCRAGLRHINIYVYDGENRNEDGEDRNDVAVDTLFQILQTAGFLFHCFGLGFIPGFIGSETLILLFVLEGAGIRFLRSAGELFKHQERILCALFQQYGFVGKVGKTEINTGLVSGLINRGFHGQAHADAAVFDIHDAAGRIIEPNSFNGFHENGCAREKFISGNTFTVYDKAVCAKVITDIGNAIGRTIEYGGLFGVVGDLSVSEKYSNLVIDQNHVIISLTEL